MHIDTIPNRNSRPAYLLRESVREGKRVGKRTQANLSSLPIEQIEQKLGYSRDGRPGTLQVNYGLLTDDRGSLCRCSTATPAIPRRCCRRSRR